MKKIFAFIMTGFMMLTFVSTQLQAASASVVLPPADPTATPADPTPAQSAQIEILTLRLEEIKALDKSGMTSSEKRKLRKEVRSIKQELKALSGGVYISVGALLVILILLIVLL